MSESPRSRYQAFDSSRYPVKSNSQIWRYIDFEKFCWLIEKKSLYHARLDCLGDPFEGSVTIPYAAKRASGEVLGYMRNSESEALNNRRMMYSCFATCWHACEYESPAMWIMYSHERRGVAVVSTFESLRQSANTSEFNWAILGPVDYFDFENDDMTLPFGLRGRPGYSKRLAFEHEREVRGMVNVMDMETDPNYCETEEYLTSLPSRFKPGVSVPVDIESLISRIVIAPQAQSWFEDIVRAACERVGLQERIERSSLLRPPIY